MNIFLIWYIWEMRGTELPVCTVARDFLFMISQRHVSTLSCFNPNYPSCCAKMHTLFGIIFWNNCVWLNMFCSLLNAAHFEGQLVWLSWKLEHPRPLQVCTNVCIIFAHTGAGVIRVERICALITQIFFWK